MWDKVKETVKYLNGQGINNPDFGIVLGTGLGSLVNYISIKKSIDYHEIPNFPVSTVSGHSGKLIYGELGGKTIVAMQGRFHYYEGWTMQQATFPIRVMKYLGINNIIVSNASGGVHPDFKVGDIMIITDHINLMPEHPLRGANEERFGDRFVDMHEPYSHAFINKFESIAKSKQIKVQKGVYLALQGPTFETPAEYRMVKNMGGDAVGMSTVPEVIVAKHMGMSCLGLSIITDLGIQEKPEPVSHEEVQKAAKLAEDKLGKLVTTFLNQYNK